jgi:hypothetical protein
LLQLRSIRQSARIYFGFGRSTFLHWAGSRGSGDYEAWKVAPIQTMPAESGGDGNQRVFLSSSTSTTNKQPNSAEKPPVQSVAGSIVDLA